MTEDLPLLLTMAEAAALIGISRTSLYMAIQRGEGPRPVIRLGRSARLPRAAVEEWVRQLAEAGQVPAR